MELCFSVGLVHSAPECGCGQQPMQEPAGAPGRWRGPPFLPAAPVPATTRAGRSYTLSGSGLGRLPTGDTLSDRMAGIALPPVGAEWVADDP